MDFDPIDLASWHLILRDQTDQIVGCVRFAPLDEISDVSQVRAVSQESAALILERYSCDERDVYEIGRMLIAREWQNRGLGYFLGSTAAALGRELGRQLMWGVMGTRENQDKIALRFGWERGVHKTFTLPRYDDEVSIVVGRIR
ncbi:GNAT family N-acetyltransferase [Streptomyces flavofungini]|uniref:GNAT family N-acetyltransferase n=1 Tax=Streptomyces flavofungini TaxID=68200 RepID=A0ABS0X7N3_9ACTN|nr:GNAT family N-acetyltransferase [Streptomyces flavofungini]